MDTANQSCVSLSRKFEIQHHPAYALLDSGATHVLLPGHMLPKGARSFDVTVIGKEKARCVMKSMQKTEHILLHLYDV